MENPLITTNTQTLLCFFFFFFFFFFYSSGVWTPPVLFCEGFFSNRVLQTICLGWLWTAVLLISASCVTSIAGVSHWLLVNGTSLLTTHTQSEGWAWWRMCIIAATQQMGGLWVKASLSKITSKKDWEVAQVVECKHEPICDFLVELEWQACATAPSHCLRLNLIKLLPRLTLNLYPPDCHLPHS
jgi:hypothetical protein